MAKKNFKIKALKGYIDKESGNYIEPGTEYIVSDKRLKEMKEFNAFDEYIEVVEDKKEDKE